MKRRWVRLAIAVIIVAAAALALNYAWRIHQKHIREKIYQSAIRSYSSILKQGMTRDAVETLLNSRGVKFQRICCLDEKNADADLVLIGKENAPWYCSEQNVYVAFQFSSEEPESLVSPSDSGKDVLRSITTFYWLEGCL